MFGFNFKKSAKKDETESPLPSSSPATSQETSTSNFDFIVIKQVDSRPLYTSRSPSHLSPESQSQNSHSRSHSSKHSPRSSIDWNDAVLRDSAIAFGSQKRSARSTKSTSSTRSHSSRPSSPCPSSASTSISPSTLTSARPSRASSRSRYPSVDTSVSTSGSERSMFLEADDQAAWDAWDAFRMKYRQPSFEDDEDETYWVKGGRYGPGRGYVEYTHLRSCRRNCEGRCFGK